MQADWREFLIAQGATIEQDRVAHFTGMEAEVRAARDGNVVSDLTHLSLIRVTGKDAETFLQGQFSNDLRQLGDTSQLHAYCTAQGRMLAVMRAFRRGDAIYLQLPASLADGVLKRLRMFVLRAQVSLELADNDLVRIGVSGPDLATRLRAAGLPLPEDQACITQNDITVIRLPGLHTRAQLIGTAADIKRIWAALDATPVGPAAWAWLDIRAGLPQVLPETSEQFVPQMANLDLVGGISFKKGCYPGQEIVARMHYLGRLKQRMYLAHTDACPPPGAAIYSPDFGEQAAGTVVDAQLSPNGGCDLLAVIQIASAEQRQLRLGHSPGTPVTLHPLPYSLPQIS